MNSLVFNVAGLLKQRIGALRAYPIDAEVPAVDDLKLTAPLRGRVVFLRLGDSVLAQAELSTSVQLSCDRCLTVFSQAVRIAFQEPFYPTVDVLTGVALPAFTDDLGFPIDHNHELDLSEAVRQHLLLALPLQALCRADCAGLCPRCGAVLNEGPCACPAEEPDPRFAPLQALLEQWGGLSAGHGSARPPAAAPVVHSTGRLGRRTR